MVDDHEERGEGGADDHEDPPPAGSAPGRSPVVFVSDPSAEAERITATLRGAGYVVADVAASLLSSRVAAQRPSVVLLDIDAEGALAEVARLRRLPGSGAIDFVYLGSGAGAIRTAEDARASEGSAFFLRPVDVWALVSKIEALTGGPAAHPGARRSTPPPSLPASRGPTSSSRDVPSDRPSGAALPAPGLRLPGPPLPMSTTSLADLVDGPRSTASFGSVSPELQQLLADAELRAEVRSSPDVALPSPEEEIEAVLPADVLASLDEPLDGDEDEEQPGFEHPRTGAGSGEREGTGAPVKVTTSGGSRSPTTGAPARGTGAPTGAHRRGSSAPPARVTTGGGSMSTASGRSGASDPPPPADDPGASLELGSLRARERIELARADLARRSSAAEEPPAPRPSSWHPPPALSSVPPPDPWPVSAPAAPVAPVAPVARSAGVGLPRPVQAAVVVGPSEAARFFAEAVARRASGALCFDSEGVVRRVVLRDGDLVAASSDAEGESLVQFLLARGELPRDEAARLSLKIPPYGRHAGAALVAHGWLRQDQLWQVLRAHAEGIALAVLCLPRAGAQLEPEAPGRLRGEPSVFGGATGAAVFVDLVRRAVAVDDALARLSGAASRIADGPNLGLLAECSLPPHELEIVQRARGGTVAELLARAPDFDVLAVVHALALLGVVEVVPAPDFRGSGAPDERDAPELDAIDEEAMRARVRARLELVEEGDYFAVLGVRRDATGYEIRRAFLELRRSFEPARILTPRLLDLDADVRKIVLVVEEAYEILRDAARRERYRRAIDARPG
jgi:hypothetical protein